ncbi:hypothetical protein [Rhizobium sp. C4]|uniref:hypothetical protein n=1 Tax=Rhizobium sp. C4 TaxID=1349800 RepID=UPI001E38452C|nr:hypothetical protein [Rhizobium sp. C4]MCD2173644.1 hypothetical protein [Rhizobium sp. C4]
MTYRLITFGAGQLLWQEASEPLRVPDLSIALLAYLYDCKAPVERRELARLLWPHARDAASTNLRSLLRRLTAALPAEGKNLLDVDDRHMSIRREMVVSDIDATATGSPAEELAALAERVTKQFLPAYGKGSERLDLWVRDLRNRMLVALREAFFEATKAQTDSAAQAASRRAAFVLLEQNPEDEDVRATLLIGAKAILPAHSRTRLVVGSHIGSAEQGTGETTNLPPRLALLPPDESGLAVKQQSVSNALIEDLTIDLCTSRAVSVIAPYTSEQIKASRDKVEALRRHHVHFALDTRRSGDYLFVQLIFLPADEVVWAARFALSPDGLLEQRRQIADTIRSVIAQRVEQKSPQTVDFQAGPEAYFAYLRGLQSLSSVSLPAVRKARRHFREALDHQSGFALGLAGVARTLSLEWVLTARGDTELLMEAERLARTAVDRDEQCSGALKELGVSQLYMGKIDESLDALQRAEAVSPHYADALCSYADSLNHGSRPAEAYEKIMAAIDLNPLSPDTYLWTAAGASYFLGEHERALSLIERMRDPNPASRLAAACWGMLGNAAKARACRLKVMRDNPHFDVEKWLAMIPHKESWQTELYREGLLKAGF